jgi:hypothetical protein
MNNWQRLLDKADAAVYPLCCVTLLNQNLKPIKLPQQQSACARLMLPLLVLPPLPMPSRCPSSCVRSAFLLQS